MQSAAVKHFGYDLDLLFCRLDEYDHILIAVSGGSDSVALLYLLHDWAKTRGKPLLSVATIDHGLRDESADEAEQVSLIAKKLGLPHVTECWTGVKPDSAVSQKAREVRYTLLSKIARDLGASAIALGHNCDDQRETILMRAHRVKFSDFDKMPDEMINLGLAGMRPFASYCGPSDFQPVNLLRPVLSIARAKLRLFLERTGENWIDDPSNEDDHYERVRLRKELLAHPTRYPTAYRIGEFADEVAAQREHISHNCAAFMDQNVLWQQYLGTSDGVFAIDRSAFMNSDRNLMRHLLRALIGVVGGRNFLISPDKSMKLVLDIQSGSMRRHSVGSAIIAPQKDAIRIWRENRNLPIFELDEAGQNTVSWDGRIVYRFSDEHLNQALVLSALGEKGVATIEDNLQRRLDAKPRQALFTQPAVFRNGDLVNAPMLPWCAPDFEAPTARYWTPALEQFQPDCDFALTKMASQLRYPTENNERFCKA